MSRVPRRPPSRLGDIATAGMDVLSRLGCRRAKMADVSAAAGLSAGAIYTYVESKEALLHVVIAHFFGQYAEGTPDLPVPAPPLSETLDLIGRGLRREASTPILRAAVAAEPPDDVMAELASIVEEHYSLVERLWPVLAVIEKCAVDVPELHRFYFGGRRSAQLSLLARYLEKRSAKGLLDAHGDPELSAQLIAEAVTWHGWHRLDGFDAAKYGEPSHRQVVIDFVCSALQP
jgi:AcrR family transcriptional regulator